MRELGNLVPEPGSLAHDALRASSSAPFDLSGFVFVGIVERLHDAQVHGLHAGEHISILQHLQAEFGTTCSGLSGTTGGSLSR